VLDSTMFSTEVGVGVPLVFLHGNPTSLYLWRRVIAEIKPLGRCLAPDLNGMSDSGKPPIAYRFADHARYLVAWFDARALQDVILVGHDWDGALAFDWASRQPQRTGPGIHGEDRAANVVERLPRGRPTVVQVAADAGSGRGPGP
jgi:haloalkane dehalogenase